MRLKKVKNVDELIKQYSNYKNQDNYNLEKLFKNNNPIELEIGSGKGNFIIGKAQRNSNINYLAIEKQQSVLIKALKKIENDKISNLYFISIDAKELDTRIVGKINKLYLNFSDPWPKARHERRRLTSTDFLKKYESLFENEIIIEQKTDNRNLFEFSIKEYVKNGYQIENISLDLHKDEISDNIMTEYEEKFSKMGFPIYSISVNKDIKTLK